MLRDMSEPLGDLTPAFRLYEELTGELIDWDVHPLLHRAVGHHDADGERRT